MESYCFMSLDPATVRRIARLARIGIDESDLQSLQGDLNGILGWIEQLNEVNVDGVAPMVGTETAVLRMREDIVTDGNIRDAVLSNATDTAGPYYTVPKVVE